MSDAVMKYLEENHEKFLTELFEFLSIPSISTDYSETKSMDQAVSFLMNHLENSGFPVVERVETGGHPLVFAEYNEAGKDAPTVLFYGHYDVQPVDPLNEWKSEPFKPEIREGRIFGRGTSDDKGQVFMHLAVFEALLKTNGKLPLNVKVCIEGEEEVGSANLYKLLNQNKEKYQADFVVISDSGMIADDQPTILYGLKGFTGLELTVTGPSHDLHSGLYGGAVRNPLMALSHILASMKNEDEIVTIPGFYDGVEELTATERELIKEVPCENYKKTCGITETVSEQGYTAAEHIMTRPTLEINGMYGGYQGEGTKTIIPTSATAKLTCRLVPGQDPERIQNLLEKHIKDVTPTGVTVKIIKEPLSAKAYKVAPNHPYIEKAANSYTKAFGKEVVYVRMGGSIPVVEWLDAIYHVPIVLLGFGTPDDRIHSPNESFPLEHYTKGMQTLIYYWTTFSK